MVTVVTEGIFSYCGVKVKIDTDRHLGPEQAAVRCAGEQVGHVTTAEYGSQMLALGGVRHPTGGSKKEGNVRSEELTSELQSLMRISYAVFCLKQKNRRTQSLKPRLHNATPIQTHTDSNTHDETP